MRDEKFIDLAIKTFVATLIGLGVAYIRNLGQETAALNLNIAEFRAETRGSTAYQNEINRSFKEQLDELKSEVKSLKRGK